MAPLNLAFQAHLHGPRLVAPTAPCAATFRPRASTLRSSSFLPRALHPPACRAPITRPNADRTTTVAASSGPRGAADALWPDERDEDPRPPPRSRRRAPREQLSDFSESDADAVEGAVPQPRTRSARVPPRGARIQGTVGSSDFEGSETDVDATTRARRESPRRPRPDASSRSARSEGSDIGADAAQRAQRAPPRRTRPDAPSRTGRPLVQYDEEGGETTEEAQERAARKRRAQRRLAEVLETAGEEVAEDAESRPPRADPRMARRKDEGKDWLRGEGRTRGEERSAVERQRRRPASGKESYGDDSRLVRSEQSPSDRRPRASDDWTEDDEVQTTPEFDASPASPSAFEYSPRGAPRGASRARRMTSPRELDDESIDDLLGEAEELARNPPPQERRAARRNDQNFAEDDSVDDIIASVEDAIPRSRPSRVPPQWKDRAPASPAPTPRFVRAQRDASNRSERSPPEDRDPQTRLEMDADEAFLRRIAGESRRNRSSALSGDEDDSSSVIVPRGSQSTSETRDLDDDEAFLRLRAGQSRRQRGSPYSDEEQELEELFGGFENDIALQRTRKSPFLFPGDERVAPQQDRKVPQAEFNPVAKLGESLPLPDDQQRDIRSARASRVSFSSREKGASSSQSQRRQAMNEMKDSAKSERVSRDQQPTESSTGFFPPELDFQAELSPALEGPFSESEPFLEEDLEDIFSSDEDIPDPSVTRMATRAPNRRTRAARDSISDEDVDDILSNIVPADNRRSSGNRRQFDVLESRRSRASSEPDQPKVEAAPYFEMDKNERRRLAIDRLRNAVGGSVSDSEVASSIDGADEFGVDWNSIQLEGKRGDRQSPVTEDEGSPLPRQSQQMSPWTRREDLFQSPEDPIFMIDVQKTAKLPLSDDGNASDDESPLTKLRQRRQASLNASRGQNESATSGEPGFRIQARSQVAAPTRERIEVEVNSFSSDSDPLGAKPFVPAEYTDAYRRGTSFGVFGGSTPRQRDRGGPGGMRTQVKNWDFSRGGSGRYWIQQIRQMSLEDPKQSFKNVSSILSHSDLFLEAFENVKWRMGAVSDPRRRLAVPGFNVELLINDLLSGSFEFEAPPPPPEEEISRPELKIQKKVKWQEKQKNLLIDQTRRLPTASNVVMEVLALILCSVFEPTFEETSHGYRTDRDCHTALQHARRIRGPEWFIRGDIQEELQTVDSDIVCKLIEKKIDDPLFVNIIRDAIRISGIQFHTVPTSLIGVPTTTPIGRIVTNIYLDPLDKFMRDLSRDFRNKPSKFSIVKGLDFMEDPVNTHLIARREQLERLQNDPFGKVQLDYPVMDDRADPKRVAGPGESLLELTLAQKAAIEAEYKMLKGPKSLKYLRYANTFIVTVNGSKADCIDIQMSMANFMSQELNMTVKNTSLLIVHGMHSLEFVGARIYTKRRVGDLPNILKMTVPTDLIFKKLNMVGLCTRTGEPYPSAKWYNRDREKIVGLYNYHLVLLVNFYLFADNFTRFSNRIRWVMQHSCARLLARKHKLKTRAKVFKKWGLDFDMPGVELARLEKRPRFTFMDHKFFKKETPWFL